jgi:hypothetical protein
MLFQARWTEAWYQLSNEEQQQMLARVGGVLEQVGGKTTLMCNSAWANEEFLFFGVEEYPDIEAAQRHAALLADLNWYRYVESKSMLGTPMMDDS